MSASCQQSAYLLKAAVDAWPLLLTLRDSSEVVGDLSIQRSPCVRNFIAPMQCFDSLLRTQRDQDAENDDPHLASELAPAVQRFGKVDMHAIAPGERTLTDALISAMSGT